MTSDAIPTDWESAFAAQRRMMVECQVRPFDVTHHGILTAMLAIAREQFVDPKSAPLAYSDRALPAPGGRRFLLPPMILARLLQAAEVAHDDKVLDVAGGTGYGAAILATLAARVVTLESDEAMSRAAREALGAQATCVTGPLAEGYPSGAPFDVIVVNGGVAATPAALLAQLAARGRLVAIDTSHGAPKAVRYERVGSDVSVRTLFDASAPVLEGFSAAPTFVF